MNRTPIAESVLRLEKLGDPTWQGLSGAAEVSDRVTTKVSQLVDTALDGNPRRLDVIREVFTTAEQMRRAAGDTTTTIIARINVQIERLREQLWATPLPESGYSLETRWITAHSGGHLRDFTVPGEPDLPPGFRYEPTPLLLPQAPIDVDFARQSGWGDCYLISAINAAAQWDPGAFTDMVYQDPYDPNFVIVQVHGGTYRLPATLPVDEKTGREATSTSPDGSTVVAYIEKAAATHMGSWNDLNFGVNPLFPLTWLIGNRYPVFSAFFVSDMPDADVGAVMSAAKPAVIAIPSGDTGEDRVSVLSRLNLVDNHGYTVRGDHPTAGGFKLHNTWLRLHPKPLEPKDLRALGAIMIWASDTPYQPSAQPAKHDLST